MPFSNFPVITALQCTNLIIILSSVGRCLDNGPRARAWPSPMDDRRRGLLGHGWCELACCGVEVSVKDVYEVLRKKEMDFRRIQRDIATVVSQYRSTRHSHPQSLCK
jgi:hypothetical protein